MPNGVLSNHQRAQAMLTQQFSRGEMRHQTWAGISLGLGNSKALVEDYNILKTSEKRPVDAKMLTRQKQTVGTTRSHGHTGPDADTISFNLVWQTFSRTFSVAKKRWEGNEVSDVQAIANSMENSILDLHDAIESAAITNLMANRTTVNAATYNGSFDAVTNSFEVAFNDRDKFFQTISMNFQQNNYNNVPLDVICDPTTFGMAQVQTAQGGGNSTNLGYNFQNKNLIASNVLTDVDYALGTSLAMPMGSFGILPYTPALNRKSGGEGSVDGNHGRYEILRDPFISDPYGAGSASGMEYALHMVSNGADTSATNGNTQDVVIQFELSIDIAFINAKLSNAGESSIYQVSLVP